jgi:hypothetical protein
MSTVPDATFPSDNKFGIPTLDIAQQAIYAEGSIRAWGSLSRKNRHQGTWHFYVDDYKFAKVWEDPHQLTNTKSAAVVEPNYSSNDQTPLAMFLWSVYKKRWLSRYWQSCGVRTYVDLNVAKPFEQHNLLGVPKGWKAYATRAADNDLKTLNRHAALAKAHAGGDILLLVCGGGKKVGQLCRDNLWIQIGV